MHVIVIPFRGAATGKSRLSSGISDAARRQIARAMFQHVLNVACAAISPRQVLVVTGSRTASAIARRCGAGVLQEASTGQNEAVEQAFGHLRSRSATTAAVVSADLPLLRKSDLKYLEWCAREGAVAIAPDRIGSGTNALAMPLGVPFVFHFGADSRHLHVSRARMLRARVRFARQIGLVSDVDTPAELHLLSDPTALSTLPRVASPAYRALAWSGNSMRAALETVDVATAAALPGRGRTAHD